MPEPAWISVGHTTYPDAQSGCTAILFDHQVQAAVDVRGGAPGTRETTLLDPGNIGRLDAILLSGGSAFGLRAADGVMRFLAELGRGVQTSHANVPLVSSAIIYDLAVGSVYHPTEEDGYDAAARATPGLGASGRIGAGTGATVAKLGGTPVTSGTGVATVRTASFSVSALVILNAVGDVHDPSSGRAIARQKESSARSRALAGFTRGGELENTTIGAVIVDGDLDRRSLIRVCTSAHAALARCTVPAHTILDGDTFFAVSSGTGSPSMQDTLALTTATEIAVERAITSIFV
jgi:L-aminopeptidase/D-esterase-like protein